MVSAVTVTVGDDGADERQLTSQMTAQAAAKGKEERFRSVMSCQG
jgi:hypothetical protein